MKVIGTAGHIDHGKSTLVERLTGINPDRLAEEKRRGMTIDLGFAWLALPSGDRISIVDVPGHERFIRNMLAGAGGVDVGLVVIAADEGVMPQTREHLHILNLLGIRSAVVALTKSDLVDEEWLMLVHDDVLTLLAGTSLAQSEIFPVSAITGDGVDALLDGLYRAVRDIPDRPSGRVPYLPIDRVFTVPGFGTVVTGTLHDGILRIGMELEVVPSGSRARIRGLQSHYQQVESSDAGARVAVNLAGVSRDQLKRGDVLTHIGAIRPVLRFDARLQVVEDAPFSLAHGMGVTLHLGAAERLANITVLNGSEVQPGHAGWVQVRLKEPIAAVRGQHFVLRLPAPARTIAGGEVVDLAPRHRRFDSAAILRLEGLASEQPSVRLTAALSDNRAREIGQLAEITGLGQGALQSLVVLASSDGRVVRRGDTCLGRGGWEAIATKARSLLRQYHRANPLRRGLPREELRRKLRTRSQDWPATLALLVDSGIVQERGPLLASPGWGGGTTARREEVERVLSALRSQPFSPPDGADLLSAASTDASLLAAMAEEGEIVRVANGLYFEPEAYDRMVALVLGIIATAGNITVAQARDALGTTRKYALALLEHLDGEHITRRLDDTRVLGSQRPACA